MLSRMKNTSLKISLSLADRPALHWCQERVIESHYLHRPVDVRCSPVGYQVLLRDEPVGCLIFGRPEASRVNGWYGDVADVESGKCRLSRWSVLNLARVWLDPRVQRDGVYCKPELLPGFTDRRGIWRSRLATFVVEQSLHTIVFDFLMCRPPVWMEEPYEIEEVLSYCDTKVHKGTLYRESGFKLVRRNENSIETYVHPVRKLAANECLLIARQSAQSERCRRMRARRKSEQYQQLKWEVSHA